MARRSYAQFCGLSLALDVVGERWTLLIVRELMSGPKRYSDLAANLGGIGSSLLASRLKQLEGDGVLERRYLEPPAASTVYELSAVGEELAAATLPMAQWGARHYAGGGPGADQEVRAEWSLAFLAELLRSPAIEGVDLLVEFVVGDSVARLAIGDGTVRVTPGRGDRAPDVTVSTDAGTVSDVTSGRLTLTEAAEGGGVRAEGDLSALAFLIETLEPLLPEPPAAASTPR